MTIKRIKNNDLDLDKIENKELSIQFSLDGFSFCILDQDREELVWLYATDFKKRINSPEELLNELMQIFIEEEPLRENYQKVNVIHQNNLASFVPKVLFKEENIKNYIAFNNKVFDNDFFTYDGIANHDIHLVYIPYVNINNFLIDQFGSFNYKHASSILVENLLNKFSGQQDTAFYVHVAGSHFEIIVGNSKKLQFYNTFDFITKEDFIYYILFVMEQLDINPEEIKLTFLGHIDKESELYEIVYKYVRNVSFLEDKFDITTDQISNDTIREHFTLLHF